MSSGFDNDMRGEDLSSLEDPQGEAIDAGSGNYEFP